ncbi:MAG: DUF3427 domain-containing protein, partial [Erysipelothrix sp.]|nr:DUF3427 domain-containing protein [Erysipelothrix sp.]
ALRYLEQSFLTDPERRKYNKVVFIKQRSNIISIANTFKEALNNNDFKRAIYDLLKYSKIHHDLRYKDTDAHNLVIGEQYTRKDTSWLLNWENNRAGVINGYMLNHATKTIPLFVTYSKSESIDASINYNDYFINNETFHWQSKNNRSLESKEIIMINNAKELGYSVLLFVKRSDGEEQQFYYLGELDPKAWEQSSIYSKGKDLPVVNVIYKIKTPVKEDLYSYLTEK